MNKYILSFIFTVVKVEIGRIVRRRSMPAVSHVSTKYLRKFAQKLNKNEKVKDLTRPISHRPWWNNINTLHALLAPFSTPRMESCRFHFWYLFIILYYVKIMSKSIFLIYLNRKVRPVRDLLLKYVLNGEESKQFIVFFYILIIKVHILELQLNEFREGKGY